jgi:hypothetical protein
VRAPEKQYGRVVGDYVAVAMTRPAKRKKKYLCSLCCAVCLQITTVKDAIAFLFYEAAKRNFYLNVRYL